MTQLDSFSQRPHHPQFEAMQRYREERLSQREKHAEQVKNLSRAALTWSPAVNELIVNNANDLRLRSADQEIRQPSEDDSSVLLLDSLGYRTTGKKLARFHLTHFKLQQPEQGENPRLEDKEYTKVYSLAEQLLFILLYEALEEDSEHGLYGTGLDTLSALDTRRKLFQEMAAYNSSKGTSLFFQYHSYEELEEILLLEIEYSPFPKWQSLGYLLLMVHMVLHDQHFQERLAGEDEKLERAQTVFESIEDKSNVGELVKDSQYMLTLNYDQLLCALVDRMLQATHVSGTFASRISSDPLSVFVFYTHSDRFFSEEFLRAVCVDGGFEGLRLEEEQLKEVLERLENGVEYGYSRLGDLYPAFFHSICLLAPASEAGWKLVSTHLVRLLSKYWDYHSMKELRNHLARKYDKHWSEIRVDHVAQYLLDHSEQMLAPDPLAGEISYEASLIRDIIDEAVIFSQYQTNLR